MEFYIEPLFYVTCWNILNCRWNRSNHCFYANLWWSNRSLYPLHPSPFCDDLKTVYYPWRVWTGRRKPSCRPVSVRRATRMRVRQRALFESSPRAFRNGSAARFTTYLLGILSKIEQKKNHVDPIARSLPNRWSFSAARQCLQIARVKTNRARGWKSVKIHNI